MTRKELQKSAAKAIRDWCKDLPEDGDWREPELVSDMESFEGDGDYAVVMIFHDRNEVPKRKSMPWADI